MEENGIITFSNYKSLQNLLKSRISRSRTIKIKHEFTQVNGYLKRVFEKINEEWKLSGNSNLLYLLKVREEKESLN